MPDFMRRQLFINPREEKEILTLNRSPDSDMYQLDEEMNLETVWDRLPEDRLDSIKTFHTNLRELDRTISTSSLIKHLRDDGYWQRVFQELPATAVELVEHVLNNNGELTGEEVLDEFIGDHGDEFWISPKNPGWSLHLLHTNGALYPRLTEDEKIVKFIPKPLRSGLRNVVENPPEPDHEFPVPPEKQLQLKLPSKSYFEQIPEQVDRVEDLVKNKAATERLIEAAEPLLKDPFKIFALFIGVLGNSDIGFRTLENPIEDLVEELKRSKSGHDFSELLAKYLFFGPNQPEFILGTDEEGELHCRFWREFRSYFPDYPEIGAKVFSLHNYKTTPFISGRHTFQQRLSLLIPLVLSHQVNPVEQALEWLHAHGTANLKINEPLPAGILRWIESEPKNLEREQALDILDEATRHRRGSIRKQSFRVMRDMYPDTFEAELPRAREDETKEVREWAQKQDQSELF